MLTATADNATYIGEPLSHVAWCVSLSVSLTVPWVSWAWLSYSVSQCVMMSLCLVHATSPVDVLTASYVSCELLSCT